MELDDQYNAFLEELLSFRKEGWESHAFGDDLMPLESALSASHGSPGSIVLPTFNAYGCTTTTPDLLPAAAAAQEPSFDCLSEAYSPYGANAFFFGDNGLIAAEDQQNSVKAEQHQHQQRFVMSGANCATMGSCMAAGRKKKVEGMPSKNLMAERRRRKRLNDRLSMLRSVVPKISKMDRTAILGDTIDYMKELLERIKTLREEMELSTEKPDAASVFKGEMSPNEMLARNTHKFEVERRGNGDARVDICCATRPGLLLSTLSTLEVLGMEIQQCVISCFNDFGMHASCSEDKMKMDAMSADDIKQELFRNAGYGGRCM